MKTRLSLAAVFFGLFSHSILHAADINVSPKTVRFSSQGTDTVSLEKAIKLKNSSDQAVTVVLLRREGADREDFSQSNTCGAPLNPKDECFIRIQFAPSTAGDKVATLSIETSIGLTTVPLAGKAIGPRVGASPKALRFSKQSVGTVSQEKRLTVKSAAKGTLLIDAIDVIGEHANDFTLSHDCVAPLLHKQSCPLAVQFSPNGSGQRTATARISSNAGQYDVSFSGLGYQAEPKLAPKSRRVSFSSQGTGTTSDVKRLILSNRGAASLRVNSISRVGVDRDAFGHTDSCAQDIAPGEQCEVRLVFSPQEARNHEASLVVSSNGGDATIPLVGKAVGPRPKLSPSKLTFDVTRTFGISSPLTMTLKNSGKGVLTGPQFIVTAGSATDFTVSSECGSSLQPGASCVIEARFTPQQSGDRSATFELRFPNVESALSATLRGRAEKPLNELSVSGLPSTLTSYQPISIVATGVPPQCPINFEAVGSEKIHFLQRDASNRFSFRAPIVLFPTTLNVRVYSDSSSDCSAEKLMTVSVAPPDTNKVPFLRFSPHVADLRDKLTTDHYSVFEFGMTYTYVAERYSGISCYPTPADCSRVDRGISGYLPGGMYAGDFNGDGHQDVVMAADISAREYEAQAGTRYSSKVLVLLNDGSGRLIEDRDFYDKDQVTKLENPYRIAIADFNGDGIDDIFVGNFGKWSVTEQNTSVVGPAPHGLLLSSPNGLIDASSRITYEVPGVGFLRPAHDAAAADFDGDGDIDITFAGYVLFNDGRGNFPTYLDLLTFTQNSPDASAAGDFNGDGVADIVLFFRHSNGVGGNGIQVGPDGCYTGQNPPKVEPYCSGHIAFGPFTPESGQKTNDGRSFTRIGSSVFGPNTHFNHAAVGDLDRDGDMDIVVGSTRIDRYYEGRKVQVLLNDGQGRFSDATDTHYARQPLAGQQTFEGGGNQGIGEGDIHLIDFDKDGDLDIIDSHGDCGCSDISDYPRVIVALNDGNGFFEPISNDVFPNRMELGFFAGYDGVSDGSGRVASEPGFTGSGPMHPDDRPTKKIWRSAFVDLDGEGDLDLVSYFWEYHYRTNGSPDPEDKNFYTIFSVINTKTLAD